VAAGTAGTPATEGLNAIIGQAKLTLEPLVAIPPGPPCIPKIL
jgi:hypothetical protein